eukprot:TRINITY_DN9945_c0_g1_i1.p2 TRINITY_DN9945_c0_g1~~TRINITY_DN9945_c0_g1_i1.p2  ORF type:complete len:336 (+),score=50.57 TRINITY_DN9945_c0_g1_i1:1348-2355(+)
MAPHVLGSSSRQLEMCRALQGHVKSAILQSRTMLDRLLRIASRYKASGTLPRRRPYRGGTGTPTNIDEAHFRWETGCALESVGLSLCWAELPDDARGVLLGILSEQLQQFGLCYWRDLFNGVGLALSGPCLPDDFQALLVGKLSACRGERHAGSDHKVMLHRATFLIMHALSQPKLQPKHHSTLVRRLASLLPKLHHGSLARAAAALPSVFDHVSDPALLSVLVKCVVFLLRAVARLDAKTTVPSVCTQALVDLFDRAPESVRRVLQDAIGGEPNLLAAGGDATAAFRAAVDKFLSDYLKTLGPKNKRPAGTGRRSLRTRQLQKQQRAKQITIDP